jgi:hypothetical protein
MSKIYQPIIIERVDEMIEILTETNFFSDYDLESTDFAKTYLLDKLTEKFISGEYDMEEDEFFEEDEFATVLREIVAGTILYDLKNKGFVESYSDESTEERFFLTEKGRDLLKDEEK